MEKRRRKMDVANMVASTKLSQSRLDATLKLAAKFQEDPQKTERLAASLCIPCFYSSALGGAAITQEPCMCCGAVQIYGSTNTDALCMDCAQETHLCKHCGGDVELRTGRKNWPRAKDSGVPAL
ncbi:MAG: hypothetical protein M0Z50_03340 [Planctomycetia bacterium]|nr:hypothetical protein [Planctomycetia bacterium]